MMNLSNVIGNNSLIYIVTITYVNCYSVNLATSTQNIFTAAKLLAIIIIICGGIVHIFQGHTEYISKGFEGSKFAISDIATAFYSGLWAYDGWFVFIKMKKFHKSHLFVSIGITSIMLLKN